MEGFDKNATAIKKTVTELKGMPKKDFVPAANSGLLTAAQVKENILVDMKEGVRQLQAMRAGTDGSAAVDIPWSGFISEKWGFSADDRGLPTSFYEALGINPSEHKIEQLFSMPEFNEGYRWLVPEIVRDAIRTGMRRNPIYPNLIAAEETISQPRLTMPSVNMSEALAKRIGEAETIPMGNVSFTEKEVKVSKIGIGLKITDEVLKFSSINLISIFLQDVGVKLNMALDTEAIDTLVNGDQAGGTDAVSVIGVTTTGTFAYRDLLRAWIRMGRIGRLPAAMLANENPAIDILEIAEFKALAGIATLKKIEVRTPVPESQALWIHGAMASDNQVMLIDPTSALIKLNASPLQVETDRIVERQISGTYVSLMTGFATLFRDARLVVDKSLAFSSNGFPTYMNVGQYETIRFK